MIQKVDSKANAYTSFLVICSWTSPVLIILISSCGYIITQIFFFYNKIKVQKMSLGNSDGKFD